MANNWENSNQVLQAICPTNALKLDDMNQPSVMVFIPAFRLCDVLSTNDTSIHPAFRRNGVQKDGFWFGKFESKMYNGRAYSRPNEDPTVSMNQDQFVAQTKSKGEGWQVHKLDEMTTPQGTFYNLQCWYGSSQFDPSQMHRLIELIVQECQQQGIPTMTPEEIAKLKGLTDDAPTNTQ